MRSLRLLAVCAVVLAACADGGPSGEAPTGPGADATGADACDSADLPLREPGLLTVAWDPSVGEPWFVGDPASGQGFEAALVHEVASRLRLPPEALRWVEMPTGQAFEPGEKAFDLLVGRVVGLPERETRADLSRGYLRLDQAVVAAAGTAAARATGLADLAALPLGALVGQQGLIVIDTVIRPKQRAFAYAGPAEAAAALEAGEVGAVLMDLPAAVALIASRPDLLIVGRVRTGQQYVLVLPGRSGLRTCVDRALKELRADGTLRRLEREWLGAFRGIQELAP